MEDSERIQKQRQLVEKIGRQNEKEGYQPVTARIMGLLTVMDKEEYTFEEIVQEMQISKSSASNALKNLEIRGAIEYVTYPGDRKRYFRLASGDILEIMDEIEKTLLQRHCVLKQIIELKLNQNSRNTVFLKSIIEGISFFIEHIDKLRAEYKN